MAFLSLQGIGKIYVSDTNVSVGIRGVDLSFERGEFVAVTGRSGSGKSTLLNVISGMDSYEEGELFIENEPTSHYLQKDWEEYREKYISFIFQDYNIIESFTVLENVELALLHIEDKRERLKRALDLIDRVGLSSHKHQKGSRLSGGQKQRTVIARALAKDSPIILADEPTGNLDSVTSREIIELLYEVSRDKLLIVVTHNFEDFEKYATRHIRIFDGAVESDHAISAPRVEQKAEADTAKKKPSVKKALSDGKSLGVAIYKAKPRLTVFLSLLLLIGTLGVFLVTSLSGEAALLFEKQYMFTPLDGRVVITNQNGAPISDDALKALAEEYGAEDYLHYDLLLDQGNTELVYIPSDDSYERFTIAFGEDYGKNIIGRYPEAEDEVFLYMPISYQPSFGKHEILRPEIKTNSGKCLRVVGMKYFYDNNMDAKMLFTREGFEAATYQYYLSASSVKIGVELVGTSADGGMREDYSLGTFVPLYGAEGAVAYIFDYEYQKTVKTLTEMDFETTVTFVAQYFNYYGGYDGTNLVFTSTLTDESLVDDGPEFSYSGIALSTALMEEIAGDILEESYRQASLFFADNASAERAAELLNERGYIAVPADTECVPDPIDTILNTILGLFVGFFWVIAILFLAFFINLCANRSLAAFKNDMAIMRSMGISVGTIRIGMYVRMLLSLIPAYVTVILTAILIFTSPKANAFFTYLYAWQYALIFLGMLLLALFVTHGQIKKLFHESVKKALKGGNGK